MSESFLYYVWQFQYFNKTNLLTTDGDSINIFVPGIRNSHAGPDFQNARVKINNIEWIGSVEIHVNAADWVSHQHQFDDAYENVILHVVWKNDKALQRNDGTYLPTLELKDRVDLNLLLAYKKLVSSPEQIPCVNALHNVPELLKVSMLDKALLVRLEHKAQEILYSLEHNKNDWEQTAYQVIAKNFGFKVNTEPFGQLASGLPHKILMKHADKLLQLEALLLGQAGFLESELNDGYYQSLKREYTLLSQKYNLVSNKVLQAQWKFLRLRPANFPTIRLAQFAGLIFSQRNLFSKIIDSESAKDLINLFTTPQSEYWRVHYHFTKKAKSALPNLGINSIENVIINSVVPLMVAYGKLKDDVKFTERAIRILEELHPEDNHITRHWKHLGMSLKTSFDSQAYIELYNNFCFKRRCLDCTIGASILKPVQQ